MGKCRKGKGKGRRKRERKGKFWEMTIMKKGRIGVRREGKGREERYMHQEWNRRKEEEGREEKEEKGGE